MKEAISVFCLSMVTIVFIMFGHEWESPCKHGEASQSLSKASVGFVEPSLLAAIQNGEEGGYWEEEDSIFNYQNGIYLFKNPTRLSRFVAENPNRRLVAAWEYHGLGFCVAFEPRENSK
ncbi:MAG: hypothetical protein AAB407_04220 [Patescibacteria group bacterium]